MAEKYWTEGGDRRVNNFNTGPEPAKQKLSDKHYKKGTKPNM